MISSTSRGGGIDDIIHKRQNTGKRLAFIPQGGVFHVDASWRGGFLLTNGVLFKWFLYFLPCLYITSNPAPGSNKLSDTNADLCTCSQMDSICQNILYYPNKHTLGMLLTPIPVRTPKVFPLSKISFLCGESLKNKP